jgi:hypothetical protein
MKSISGVASTGGQALEQVHVWPMELLDEGVQRLDGLDDDDLVMVNWGELRKLIHYNQVISKAFMETSEIFVGACEEIKVDME